MKSIKFILIGALITLAMASCVKDEVYTDNTETPELKESYIKLNEILSTGDPDWLELYNSSDVEIDLEGYILADKNTEWTIPEGIKIASKGFITFDCDGDGITNPSFKISSGGELMSLKDPDGVLIDQIDVPSLSDYTGLTYARIPDGEATWEIATATKGAANSNENKAPIITATELNESIDIYKLQVSDADGVASVKLILITDNSIQSVDMTLLDGDYQTSVPTFTIGTKVEYYVEAKDITGKTSYYPSSGSSDPNFYYITGNAPLFISVDFEGAQAGYLGDVTFTASVFDNDSVEEVKLYYLTQGQTTADKVSVILTIEDSVFVGVIPSQNAGTIVSYYLRAKNINGTKTYYPIETGTSDFDHDDETTWPNYMAGAPVVINGFSQYFTTTPTGGTDLTLNVTYEYDEAVQVEFKDVKMYYTINDTYTDAEWAVFVDAGTESDNGRNSFEIVNKSADNKYSFTIPADSLSSGDQLRVYFRGYTKNASGTKLKNYFTPDFDDTFDHDIYSQWSVININ